MKLFKNQRDVVSLELVIRSRDAHFEYVDYGSRIMNEISEDITAFLGKEGKELLTTQETEIQAIRAKAYQEVAVLAVTNEPLPDSLFVLFKLLLESDLNEYQIEKNAEKLEGFRRMLDWFEVAFDVDFKLAI